MTDWTAAHGALTAYPDIPAEYLTGLATGKLGDWLQEVHEAGLHIHATSRQAWFTNGGRYYTGRDDATNRVDIMLLRAFLAWKGREVSV